MGRGIPSFFCFARCVVYLCVPVSLVNTPPFFPSSNPVFPNSFMNASWTRHSTSGLFSADIISTQSHLGSHPPGLARRPMARRGQDSLGAQSPLKTSRARPLILARFCVSKSSLSSVQRRNLHLGVCPFPSLFRVGKRSKARAELETWHGAFIVVWCWCICILPRHRV